MDLAVACVLGCGSAVPSEVRTENGNTFPEPPADVHGQPEESAYGRRACPPLLTPEAPSVPFQAVCAGGDSDDLASGPVFDSGGVLIAWTAIAAAPSAGPAAAALTAEIVLARASPASVTVLRTAQVTSAAGAMVTQVPTVELWPGPASGAYVRISERRGAGESDSSVDLGLGPHVLPYTVQLDASGSVVRDLCSNDGCDVRIVAARGGSLVVHARTQDSERIDWIDPDGGRVRVWARDAAAAITGAAVEGCPVAVLVPDGDLVCIGTVEGPLVGGTLPSTGQNPFVARLAPDGTRRWTVTVPGITASVGGAGSTATGDVVVAGAFKGRALFGKDLVSWPCEQAIGMGLVLTFDAEGRPQAARTSPGEIRAIAVASDGSYAAAVADELRGISTVLLRAADGTTASWDAEAHTSRFAQVRGLAARPDSGFVASVWFGDANAPPGTSVSAHVPGDVGVVWFDPRAAQ